MHPESPFGKSRCGQPLAVWVGEAVNHEADHGGGEHDLGHLGQMLIVLGQTAPPSESAECPLHDPAAREHDEAFRAWDAADNDQREAEQEAGEQRSAHGAAATRL